MAARAASSRVRSQGSGAVVGCLVAGIRSRAVIDRSSSLARSWATQRPSNCSPTPISRATSAIVRPVSITSRAASTLSAALHGEALLAAQDASMQPLLKRLEPRVLPHRSAGVGLSNLRNALHRGLHRSSSLSVRARCLRIFTPTRPDRCIGRTGRLPRRSFTARRSPAAMWSPSNGPAKMSSPAAINSWPASLSIDANQPPGDASCGIQAVSS